MVSSAKMLVQSMGSLQRRVLTTGTTNTSNKFLSFSRHIFISSQVLRSLKGRYQGHSRYLNHPIRCMSSDMVEMIKSKNVENPVMIYSKTYCPFCHDVKSLFEDLHVPAKVVELDELEDGQVVSEGLLELTGKRTVPQVFVGGTHVGGCDDTFAAYQNGRLKELLASKGISI